MNITALTCLFVRSYYDGFIYQDDNSRKLLSDEEYDNITNSFASNISFFNPKLNKGKNENIKWIVNNILAPSIITRDIFLKEKIAKFSLLHDKFNYFVFASGYDVSSLKLASEKVKCFEIDLKNVIEDKLNRLNKASIDHHLINYIACDLKDNSFLKIIKENINYNLNVSFVSLLGFIYYLSKEEFIYFLKKLITIITINSEIVFDYPSYEESETFKYNESLALNANSQMKVKYTSDEINKIFIDNGFMAIENINNDIANEKYLKKYNENNADKIYAFKGVNYCLVRKIK
ncbi:MAG: class I SAM-dependent methyltransferase [Erysipelotrichaceae bacterium]|nr:class I SAM-dependent methyltransferase [Erysipelotrichaceae bacterium]